MVDYDQLVKFWKLPDQQKLALLAAFEAGHQIDYNQFSASEESIRRYLRMYRQEIRNTPEVIPSPDHSDPYVETDAAEWMRLLKRVEQKRGRAITMHYCDMHFPYQRDDAVALTHVIARSIEPDIIVVGSDAFDFALLSTFGMDPDASEDEDQLDLVERHWNPFIHDLKAAAPNAILVFIWGNHDRRLIYFMLSNAPQIRRRIWRDFRTIIRCGGAVLWLGEVDGVQIGQTLVQHGTRTGKYAATREYEDVGGQLNVMSGHNHKFTTYEKRGALYTIKSVGSGCLCDLDPHYVRGRKQRGWQLGTVIGDIDLRGHVNDFPKAEYFDGDTGLECRLGLTSFKVAS